MTEKAVVVTGTTSGTGRVAALTVAELGAKVMLLNRVSERSSSSFFALTTQHPNAEIHQVECDLQSFESVKSAAERIRDLSPEGVHVLCNNAGVMALADTATEDGFDIQMQTNHLSHFLLTRELMPLIEKAAEASGDARIVNHSSVARMSPGKELLPEYFEKRGGQLGGDGTEEEAAAFRGPRWIRYNQTKLANAAFTAALHDRLQKKGSNVRALVAHPGLAQTELQITSTKHGGMSAVVTGQIMRFGQSSEDGTMGILSGMCLPNAESGQFYGPGSGSSAFKGKAEPFPLEDYYDNPATRDLLWSKSEEAIGSPFDL